MIAIAVAPIASPIGTRPSEAIPSSLATAAIGDAGCRSSVAIVAAETMNNARQSASIRYSGQ
jgi:hypothetical protein